MKGRLLHLDCLRGLAALLVCFEHLRAFLFVQYSQLKQPGIVDRFFYFGTGLGHQGVMIFFVMSGFLVGGSVIASHRKRTWSWTGYALRRMTRLWLVLIPALLLTLCWDSLGRQLAPAGYEGQYRLQYCSGPGLDDPTDLRPSTFFGNVFFLQTILVNCYGTNGPLWSLANEFWYYLLFPLLLGVLAGNCWLPRLLFALLAAAIIVLLPRQILQGGLVWLLGAAVYVIIQNQRARRWAAHPVWLLGSGLLAVGLLVASRLGQLGAANDLLLGAGFACLMAALAVRTDGSGNYARLSAGASDFSYTLYLVHFPVLALLFFSVFHGRQLQPGLVSTLWFTGVLLAILFYSALVWWCFERNTDRFRKWLEQSGRLLRFKT